MQTITISTTYYLKHQLNFATHYKFTLCKKLINCKTGKIIKKIMNGGSIGYCIEGKFYSLTALRKHVELMPEKEYCPF